ncbi:hypothetical protein Pint_01126 [Pistacia integerrima]|uniref:Uncharacterized protein n=1 Tax=Pistacia integerrima TaxID=434235 RepID=A0ACC0ZFA4_9ROSI|nr:hypothetical protein Pint_01126 [Pistacia integerrima]
MHEKKNNSNPLGICHRLFHFMNNLIDRSLYKRRTLGPPVSQGPSEKIRIQYRDHDENSKDHYRLSSEIPIQLKQSEGLDSWTAVNNMGSSIQLPQLQKDPAPKYKAIGKKVKEIPLVHDKTESSREKRKGAKESEEEEKTRKKGKNKESDQNSTSPIPKKDEDTNVNITPGQFLTNINEKSEEFIRTKKANMSKDRSLL